MTLSVYSVLRADSCNLQAPKINWEEAQKGRFGPGGYLGVTSVPLPAQQKAAQAPEAVRAQVLAERHRQEDLVQARPWAFLLEQTSQNIHTCMHRNAST